MTQKSLLKKIRDLETHTSSSINKKQQDAIIVQLVDECMDYNTHDFVEILKASLAKKLFQYSNEAQDDQSHFLTQSKKLQQALTQSLVNAKAKEVGILIETITQLDLIKRLESTSILFKRIENDAHHFSKQQVFCALKIICQTGRPLPENLAQGIFKYRYDFSYQQHRSMIAMINRTNPLIQLDNTTKDTLTYLEARPSSPRKTAIIAAGITAIVVTPLYLFSPLLSLVTNALVTPLYLLPTPIDNTVPLLRFFPIILKTPILTLTLMAPILIPTLLVGFITHKISKNTHPD